MRRLRDCVAGNALLPTGDHVDLGPYLEIFRRTYGPKLVGVIFYGSCISPHTSKPTSTPDFFVVTDDGRLPAHSLTTRLLHPIVPPNTQTAVISKNGEPQRFKYIHLDAEQLLTATSPSCRDFFIAGRLSKGVRIVLWRDETAKEKLLDALTAAVTTLAPVVWALLPRLFDLDELVTASIAVSYLSEWRIDAAGKIEALIAADPDYYHRLFGQVLTHHIEDGRVTDLGGGRYQSEAQSRDTRRAVKRLRRSRWRGAMRWPKYILTVGGAGEVMASKMSRAHPEIRFSAFAHRHPYLYSLPFLMRVLANGALRIHKPATDRRTPPLTTAPVSSRRHSYGLVTNCSARRNRNGGFNARVFADALGAGGVIRSCDSPAAFPGIIDELQSRGVSTILVLGGDGTFGSIVTEVIHRWEGPLPTFVPLRGGGLNNTAKVLGAGPSPLADVRALVQCDSLYEHRLRPLRVRDPARLTRDTYGFIFAVGLVDTVARIVDANGGSNWWNTALTTARLVPGLFGIPPARAAWQPKPGLLSIDGEPLPHDGYTILTAHAVAGTPWFVNIYPKPQPAEANSLVYLANAMRHPKMARQGARILRGTCSDPEHHVGHAGRMQLKSRVGYMLDGELQPDLDRETEVDITPGPVIRICSPRGPAT